MGLASGSLAAQRFGAPISIHAMQQRKFNVQNRLALGTIRWNHRQAHSGKNEKAASTVELSVWVSAWVY
jgi:hypothetical protein